MDSLALSKQIRVLPAVCLLGRKPLDSSASRRSAEEDLDLGQGGQEKPREVKQIHFNEDIAAVLPFTLLRGVHTSPVNWNSSSEIQKGVTAGDEQKKCLEK